MIDVVASGGCGALAAQTAGTPYTLAVPGKKGAKTRMDFVVYTAAGTAHTLTAMRPLGKTTVASTAAAAQAVINITAQPGPTGNAIAANDWCVVRRAADGIYYIYQVANVSTLAITMTANVPAGAGLSAGDLFWFFGVPADTDPLNNGLAHPNYALAASATTTVDGSLSGNGFISSHKRDEPLLLHVNNATAAGAFNRAGWLYTYEPGSPISLLGETGAEGGDDEGESGAEGEGQAFMGGKLGGFLKDLPMKELTGKLSKVLLDWLMGQMTNAKKSIDAEEEQQSLLAQAAPASEAGDEGDEEKPESESEADAEGEESPRSMKGGRKKKGK